MSDGRWLEDATGGVEAGLREGLDEARARLPDQVAMRRLWSRVANPELAYPARPRWTWFAGGAITSSALALGLAMWLWPARSLVGPTPAAESAGGAPTTTARVATAGPAQAAASAGAARAASPAADHVANDHVANDHVAGSDPRPVSKPLNWTARPASVAAPGVVRTGAGETLQVTLRGGTEARLERSSIMNVEAQPNGHDRPTVERGEVAFSVPHQAPGESFWVTAGPYRIVVVGTKFRLRVENSHVAVAVDEGVVEIWRRKRLARLVPGDSWSSPAEPPAHGSAASAPSAAAPAAEPAAAPASGRSPAIDPEPEARAALAADEPRRAIDAYRTVAARGGPAAENAEYEIGKILRDRLGQPEDAIAAWRRYRTLHPDGLLRIETDVSIIETLVSSGNSTVALVEANDFLRRHPESERRGEIARVAGDLYRARGDCAHAVTAYQTALTSQRTKDVAEYAAFHRAACLVRLGDASGTDALQTYLRAWPGGRFRADAGSLLRGTNDHVSPP
jgi:hypothetical protein